MDSASLWESRWECCGEEGIGKSHVPLTAAACVLGDCLAYICRSGLAPSPRYLLTQGNSSLVNISVPIGCCFPVLAVAPEMLAWGYAARTRAPGENKKHVCICIAKNHFFAAAVQKQISTHLSHAGGGRIPPRMKLSLPNFLLVFPIQGVGNIPRKRMPNEVTTN